MYYIKRATRVATVACFFLRESYCACSLLALDETKFVESVFGKKRLIMVYEKDFLTLFLVPILSSGDDSNDTYEQDMELLRSKPSGRIRLLSDFDIPRFSAKSLLSLFIFS